MKKLKKIVILFAVIVIIIGFFLFLNSQSTAEPNLPVFSVGESSDGLNTQTYSTTGRDYTSTEDELLHEGLRNLGKLMEAGSYRDPDGLFRIKPVPEEFRLYVYLLAPQSTSKPALTSWLTANYPNIPDFKITFVEVSSL